MISLDLLYYIVGILFLVFGILSFSNQAKDICKGYFKKNM